MRKLLLCIALTAVCGVASTTSSQALVKACAFVCCNSAFLKTTPCTVNGLGTTCGAWLATNSCP